MALIRCPECEKEISNKVKTCPHCGYPFDNKKLTFKKRINKKLIIIIASIIMVCISAMVIVGIKVLIPNIEYKKALGLMGEGQYEAASEILQKIPDYQDVELLQEQILYETYTFECVKSLKKRLKNPDSLQLYEVEFYGSNASYPVCVFHYGAQNGFGGNTTGYALFSPEDFSLEGTCDSLDITEYDKDDDDEVIKGIIAGFISKIKEGQEIGSVDIGRVKKILKDNAYGTVKIIN